VCHVCARRVRVGGEADSHRSLLAQDEVVVYSGHWDHFGKRADGIYHGARDNALSVAALLELAKAFASVPQVRCGVRCGVWWRVRVRMRVLFSFQSSDRLERLASQEQRGRSVLFLAPTAEEQGLLVRSRPRV
jgi:Zn-dependent M28 family amino/carboxypeptidase